METLVIDPEIQSKIPALTDEEFNQLQENILEEGQILMPIICWNDTIIDGHNRYKIAQEHPEIPFQVKRIDFENKYEAIVWMCHNQLGRRNITPESRKILIGTAYEAQKMALGGERHMQHDESGRFTANGESHHLRSDRHDTRKDVAKKFETSVWEVQNSTDITRGVNAAEEISPGFKDAYVSGTVKSPDYTVKEITKVPEDVRPSLVKAIERGDNREARQIIESAKPQKPLVKESADPYNLEDFEKSLNLLVDRLDTDLNMYFVSDHAEMLETNEGLEIAYKAIKSGREVLDRYEKEVIDTYKN